MLLFVMERGDSAEPDAMRKMNHLAQELADQGKLRRGAPLADEAESVRVRVRDGKALVHDGPYAESKEVLGGFWIVDVADRAEALVVDGPFAEAKEAVGGYSIVRAENDAEALAIAKRYPHARWGPLEVRRILFLDRVSR
ncbi:MAG TPA: YciI family protein [Myxococcota bacterium]|nr:YciI family protein [Myxococcota bacterium]